MSNTPVTLPEFGVYRISKDYLRFIRESNPGVEDPDFTNTYCGPVARRETNRGPVDYFVPIDVDTFAQKPYLLLKFPQGFIPMVMFFSRMIPCLPRDYELDASNTDLVAYCKYSRDTIEKHATAIFDTYDNERGEKNNE